MMIPFLIRALVVIAVISAANARDTLMTCSSVRAMSSAEADKYWRVDLRGVVVCRMHQGKGAFVMQDGTGSVFVELPEGADDRNPVALDDLKPGMTVSVTGFTIMGEHSPRVKLERIVKEGQVGLPTPMLLDAGEVADGKYEDRYVEFNAVVRGRAEENGGLVVNFGPENRTIVVKVWLQGDDRPPAVKTDDLVRVRGVVMNRKTAGQPSVETVVIAEEGEGLEVLFSAPEDALSIPETPLGVLLAQPHDPFLERRRKVVGVVTLFWPGRVAVIQNELYALRITPPQGLLLERGDRVKVAGIPTLYEDGLLMEQSLFSKPEPGDAIVPEAVMRKEVTEDAMGMGRDSRYLTLGGVVVETGHRERDHVVSVESDHGILRCLLPRSERLPDGLEAGAYVEVSGVCRLLYGWEMGTRLKDFELLLPDLKSIRVRTVPSWWTPWRLGTVFSVSSVAVGGLVVWGIGLRRKVRVRTKLLAKEMHSRRETELISGERSRLAMELHDGISQVLSAAAFQLEAAARDLVPEERKDEKLQLAKRLLEHGREDLRRAVWDLAPGVLDRLGFKGALEKMAEEIAADGCPRILVVTSGPVEEIPSRVRSHLFRLVQEAAVNAVRHSEAECIRVEVEAGDEWVMVAVRDDGAGFDPGSAAGPETGHFGLYSMKSRVGMLKGTMDIESSAAGTSILVRIPADAMMADPSEIL